MLSTYLTKKEQELLYNLRKYFPDSFFYMKQLVVFYDSYKGLSRSLSNLVKKGFVYRLKKGLYVLADANLEKAAIKFHTGYLFLDSALRYYNLIDYEVFQIKIATSNYREKFKVGQYEIKYIPIKDFFGFYVKNDILISSIEKTIYDLIKYSRYISYEIILKALIYIDFEKINLKLLKNFISRLTKSNKRKLCYLLELAKVQNKTISKKIFNICNVEKKVVVYLESSTKAKGKLNKKWQVVDNVELYKYFKF